MTDWHRGRSWAGHPLEDECPCPQQPCGLIVGTTADPDCEQHGRNHRPRTTRQGHPAHDCPGGHDTLTMLQLAHDALTHAKAGCPQHEYDPAEGCAECAQALRVRKARNAFLAAGYDLTTTPTRISA